MAALGPGCVWGPLCLQWAGLGPSWWRAGFLQWLLCLQSVAPVGVQASAAVVAHGLGCPAQHVGPSWTGNPTHVPGISRWVHHHWATREVPETGHSYYVNVSITGQPWKPYSPPSLALSCCRCCCCLYAWPSSLSWVCKVYIPCCIQPLKSLFCETMVS